MTAVRPILLIGANGQIGTALAKAIPRDWPVLPLARTALDLERPAEIRRLVRQVLPRVIVNAAAYTDVDRAESNRSQCLAINAHAPEILAEEAAKSNALLVHYSTDYVFDGRKDAPYQEIDIPSPLNVYGESKAAADAAIAGSSARHIILRTSWVYGDTGKNFVRTILAESRARSELRVVDDQVGVPTAAEFVARITIEILGRILAANDEAGGGLAGLYHLAASGSTTWFRFAKEILTMDRRRQEQVARHVVPITAAEFGSTARRPRYSVLDTTKLRSALDVSIPPWSEQLHDFLRRTG